jgi:hypothetical protein
MKKNKEIVVSLFELNDEELKAVAGGIITVSRVGVSNAGVTVSRVGVSNAGFNIRLVASARAAAFSTAAFSASFL